MRIILLFLTLVLVPISMFSQVGEISGKVKDEKGEGIPFATIVILQNNVPTGKVTQTDFDGNYSLKPLTPGKYDVKFSYVGYTAQLRTGVVVSADKITFIDVQLKPQENLIQEVQVIEYKVPLIDPGKTTTGGTITSEEIAKLPTRDVTTLASTTGGVGQSDNGAALNLRGGRSDGTAIFIDGVRVRGSVNLPANAISQISINLGGLPAKYGDATGGAIAVTTKGPSSKFVGGFEGITSYGMDAYGYILGNGNVSGPIYTSKKNNRTVAGFFLAGEYEHFKDPSPSAIGVWQVKDDVMSEIKANPLVKNPRTEGFILSSETVTKDDLFLARSKPNVATNKYTATGRLDFKPSEAISLAFGGFYNYYRYHDWVDRYTVFNAENNPLYTEQSMRGFARLTHNIGTGRKEEEGGEKKSSAIQNIFYTIQFDYEKFKEKYGDDTHDKNFFDYGYIGKFDIFQKPTYEFVENREVVDSNGTVRTLTGWQLVSEQEDSVHFTYSDVNALGSRITENYFDLAGPNADGFYENLQQIQAQNGLVNGQRAGLVHDIWFNIGRQYNGYGLRDNDQFTAKLDGSFDILKPGSDTRNKHSIEFGFVFEQRVERQYTINPLDLWTRARALTNVHLEEFDTKNTNPYVVINGVKYLYNDPSRPAFGFNDTILADRIYSAGEQSNFDRNLRSSLGLNVTGTDFINIDALAPSDFKLDMFSADELINAGGSLIGTVGYDYLGNKLNGKNAFYDYFTKKDANGNFERNVPAFRPIYVAGYIQDKFQFRDLTFNVGVRVDRYDANQKVMKDPYSLYQIRTVAELNPDQLTGYVRPSNVGDDYKVYIDDNNATKPVVVGYRNGDQWYDATGKELANGAAISRSTASGKITPFLVDKNQDIRNPDRFDPDQSFTDYKPQVNVMPRLQFSFNLTDKALFFAHYDVLTQRPQASSGGELRSIADPQQYLWFDRFGNGGFINNPDLKPEKTIDFELGFRQKVSNTSAITISAYYREFKDQVQLIKRFYTYPGTGENYLTMGNVDFATVKGFTIDYDLRRTGNIRMQLNYTLQFAEGTGSDNTSQQNILSANQPNFRTIFPLNFDARHTFNVTLDWRYGQGGDYNGPYIGKQQIFSNAGINFTLTARSGTPYSKQSNATPEGLNSSPSRPITEGALNGSRLPWTFRLKHIVTGIGLYPGILAKFCCLSSSLLANSTEVRYPSARSFKSLRRSI